MTVGTRPAILVGFSRDAFWNYIDLFLASAGNLLVVAYAVRRLGPAGYGVFALIATVAALLVSFDFGLSLSVTRAAARENATHQAEVEAVARREVQTAHSAYFLLALGAGAAVMAIVVSTLWLPGGAELGTGALATTVLLVGATVVVFFGTAAFSGIARGQRAYRLLAIASLAGAVAQLSVVTSLLATFGLPALGLGMLINVVVVRCVVAMWLRRQAPWFSLWPSRASRREFRQVAAFAGPLLVVSIAGHIVSSTDLFVVAALTTAANAGLYKVGSLVPVQAIAALYRGYDTVFPGLAASEDSDEQEAATRFLTRIVSFVAGVGFAGLAMLRGDVVNLLAGRHSAVASSVLLVFCIVWTINVTTHGLALLLIVRDRHRVFVPLVAAESVINLLLTFVLVSVTGPVGGAYASLVALGACNAVVLPLVVRDELKIPAARVIREGLLAASAGWACGSAAVMVNMLSWSPAARLASGAALSATVGAAVGWWVLGRSGRERLRMMLSARPVAAIPAVRSTEHGVLES